MLKESFKKVFRRRPMNMGQTIALVFLLIIIVGTTLLCLPFSSRSGESSGVLTALFTATSSTCVTGLALADTWTQWSGFGQVVILCLIEVGGLGFMFFASSVIFLLRKKVSMNERIAIAFTVGSDDMEDAVRIQKRMLYFSIGTEAIGALLLTFRFLPEFGLSKALKLGVFHSISAFCNAGFDIFGFQSPGSSVTLYGTDTAVILILSFLIIFGGIGFLVWDEIFRIHKPKKWSVYTKLVLLTTVVLLIAGTIFICLTEWNNPHTLGNMDVADKLKAGFFQSVTARTAGFAGVDQGALTDAGKSVTMFFMLIGGSSGSTAGGLKTVTFFVIMLFLWSAIRGQKNVHVFHRTVSGKHIQNALTIFGIMVFLSFFGGVFICATSSISFTDGLYEAVSALATVGLTTGVTTMLSVPAKLLIIVYMYFGRVGILTLSLGFLQNKDSRHNYRYADVNLLIG